MSASELRSGFLAEPFGKFSSRCFHCCHALIKHASCSPLSFTGPFGPGTVRAFVAVRPPDPSLDGYPVGSYSRLVSLATRMPSADCHSAFEPPCGSIQSPFD